MTNKSKHIYIGTYQVECDFHDELHVAMTQHELILLQYCT